MLGRAPQTKETLPDFCENMDPDKWETIVWYRVTQNPQEFRRLTGCQQDPRIWGVTLSLKKVSKYLYIVSGSVIGDHELLYLVFVLRLVLETYRVFLLGKVFLWV